MTARYEGERDAPTGDEEHGTVRRDIVDDGPAAQDRR